jgi:hypothetical protein
MLSFGTSESTELGLRGGKQHSLRSLLRYYGWFSDRGTEGHVQSAPHRAHSTLAELADEAITPGQNETTRHDPGGYS